MKRKGIYLVTDVTPLELPEFVADTLREVAIWLGVTPQRASNALYNHEAVGDRHFIYFVRSERTNKG